MVAWNGGRRREFPRWMKAAILRRDPVCKICHERPSVIADHRQPVAEGGPDLMINGQGLCVPCHDRKTEAEKARGRARASGKRKPEPHPGYR